MNSFLAKIDGREIAVKAQIIERNLWFKIESDTFCIDLAELQSSHHRKSSGTAKKRDQIAAPMPGKITKIFVSAGQMVDRGAPLLVMEAMKMEYTLKSDLNAGVSEVKVSIGDQVSLGQLLVQLKES
jgi:acetyl/propionyl-CoA carboxylase alpha subunit